MANYAGVQQYAQNSNTFPIGIPFQELRAGDTIGGIAQADSNGNTLVIGGAGFINNTFGGVIDKVTVLPNNSASGVFGGIVIRSNYQASTIFYTQGYSNKIDNGEKVELVQRGTIGVLYDQTALSTPVAAAVGDIVFVLPATGKFFTAPAAGSTIPTGAVQTNFNVSAILPDSGSTNTGKIKITNRQNMGR